MFVDEVKLRIASGKGGPGAVSFRREAMTPRGGPDGGDGGRGGHVYFRVTHKVHSLVDYRGKKSIKAPDGKPGGGSNQTGADGEDIYLVVPRGTIVRRSDSGEVICDLQEEGDYLFLKGGRGGKGNHFFRTSINQAPEYAQPGEPGESEDVILELKLIADVGIIGLPNAGKSTLISRISAAKPKIANYPFTTLTPHLGVVKIDEEKSFVVADIPGLIKGASEGVGLGIQFLKHVERTKFFIHLIDISGMGGTPPMQAYLEIQDELKKYDRLNQDKEGFFPLSNREQLVILNKVDLLDAESRQQIRLEFENVIGYQPLEISGVTGLGIKELLTELSKRIFSGDPE
jgi:GTP-binding protein